MMKKNILFTLFLMVYSIASGQVLFRYPKGQKSYQGDFYKDFHQVLKDLKIEPCENKKELYNARILVNEDASVNIVQDSDEKRMLDNKCTIEVLKQVLPKMKGWVPAQVDGQKVKATRTAIIYLDDLFNYKEGYEPGNYMKASDFEDYIPIFRKKVGDYAYQYTVNKYSANGTVSVRIAFELGEKGNITNVFTVESSGNEDFDEKFERAIKDMKKKKWTPVYYRDIPINIDFVFPFTIKFE